jgi:hypothetical protein
VHILCNRALCATSCVSSLRLAGFQDLVVVVLPTGVWFAAVGDVWGLVQGLGFGLVRVWCRFRVSGFEVWGGQGFGWISTQALPRILAFTFKLKVKSC